jgi:hypothetical protein
MALVKTIKRSELIGHSYVPPEGSRGHSLRKASSDDADLEWGPGQWYDQTDSEEAAGITPFDSTYPPGCVRRYGASPDGNADNNTAAIQAAFDSGHPVTGWLGEEYPISSTITIPEAGVCIVRDLKLRPDDAFQAIANDFSATATTTLASSVRMRRGSISVTSATGMSVGDHIIILSDEAWPYDPGGDGIKKGETNRIAGISGTTITLAIPTLCDYDTATESVAVTAYTPKVMDIEGLDIDFGTPALAFGIRINNCTGRIRAVVRGAQSGGIQAIGCFGLVIDCPDIRDCYYTGLGYGIQIYESTMCSVVGGFLYNNRRGVDISGLYPSHLCLVNGVTVVGNPNEGSCLGGHGSANGCTYSNNVLSNAPIGVQIRGPNCKVEGNQFWSCTSFCILSGAPGFSLRNNRQITTPIVQTVGLPDTSDAYFFEISGGALLTNVASAEIVIAGNECSPRAAFMFVSSDTTTLSNLRIENNDHIPTNNSGGGAVNFIEAAAATVADSSCVIQNNHIRVASGTLTFAVNMTFSCRMENNPPYMEGSATFDPPSLADGAGQGTSVTVNGAAAGDLAECSFSLDLQGIGLWAEITGANAARVRFQNESGGTLDLGSGTVRVRARRIV